MSRLFFCVMLLTCLRLSAYAQDVHPDTKAAGWRPLFTDDLSNAHYPKGIWTVTDGVITPSKDEMLWSDKMYENFVLDLDFKNADGTNSGVIVHASDTAEWVSHSIEIQIADDYSEEWSKAVPSWQCAAIFGHQPASNKQLNKPGEWNHYTITCKGRMIWVVLNGALVNTFDMRKYTSIKQNPDGSPIPSWLSNPPSTIPLHGYIGFQGKHAGAPVYFRNIRIKELR
jgi:hypothetical protein